jgi:hypothetical protein
VAFDDPGALSFNNSGSVSVPNSPALSLTTFTIAAWMYPTGFFSAVNEIVQKANSDKPGFQLRLDNGTPRVTVGNASGWDSGVATYTATLNTWTHVAGVYTGSALLIYMNGTLSNSAAARSIVDYDAPLTIGRRSDGWAFNGVLDDVRVYDRVLSAGEISVLASGARPTMGISTVTLAADLSMSGPLYVEDGNLDVSAGNYGVMVSSGFLNHAGFTARSGLVTLNGSAAGLPLTSGTSFYDLALSGSGAYVQGDPLLIGNDLTVTSGSLDTNSGAVTLGGGSHQQRHVLNARVHGHPRLAHHPNSRGVQHVLRSGRVDPERHRSVHGRRHPIRDRLG